MPPVSPKNVAALKKSLIPEPIIEAFNEQIALHFCGGSSTVKQADVIDLALRKCEVAGIVMTRRELIARGYLDVEPIYEAEGWKVTYDRPDYSESYDPTFKFSRRRST